MEDQGAQITTTTPSGPTRQTNHNSSGGREDCWSEGATSALVEAWGDRYLQLSRGNLRQKDWKEVADAVNSRRDGVKPPRTDVQCKNRVDTLKKKYKAEKAKPIPSKWPFYSRLDHLVGTATATATAPAAKKAPQKAPAPSAPAVTKFTVKNMNLGFGRNCPSPVVAFGEIYERIETAKQEQLMELERQRMEVMKDVEFQRMQMFMEAQIELEKLKRAAKYSSGTGKKL
ncbi:hypothetical protein Syun_000213 [Stephania yunnanensis]|uniref:Myb/SANT-like DNA-binding domain-containing protein n=1 Tax=Stephania yunnanensis TaxID=152371 RepID=A0AAP0LBK5_9MAGN